MDSIGKTGISRVFVSGVHSGPNPSPGVGVARSLLDRWPALEVVAVDYSNRSSGLHWEGFSAVNLLPPWQEIDPSTHADWVTEQLEHPGSFWISTLDVESRWLSTSVHHPRLLVPPAGAYKAARKPALEAAAQLGLAAPPSQVVDLGGEANLTLPEQHGWPLWVKGLVYEARLVSNWHELRQAITGTRRVWGDEQVLIQAAVTGYEESVAFAAVNGRLVAATSMRKASLTETGKTWSGRVGPADPELVDGLSQFTKVTEWHGGGEIEMVHAADGTRYLIDLNVRFPAWIHGATLGGCNLPAELLAVAASETAPHLVSQPREKTQFTRLVIEVPVTRQAPGLPWSAPPAIAVSSKKAAVHPSGMPQLSARLSARRPRPRKRVTITDQQRLVALEAARTAAEGSPTPVYHFDTTAFRADVETLVSRLPQGWRAALSIKTNPDRDVLRAAHAGGMLAEAITAAETALAVDTGWKPDQIIVNGPAKRWPGHSSPSGMLAYFCDSLTEFTSILSERPMPAAIVGIRMRPLGMPSRFGVELDTAEDIRKLVAAVRRLPEETAWGWHLHMAQSVIGTARWRRMATSAVTLAAAMQQAAGRSIECLDLGGGWTTRGLEELLAEFAPALGARISSALPDCQTVLIEPGKSLSARHGVVLSTVLRTDRKHAVVDASIAELPDQASLPRPLACWIGGNWLELPGGEATVFGRTCMEDDQLAWNVDTAGLREGTLVAFGNAGAYDRSMRYSFARGGAPC